MQMNQETSLEPRTDEEQRAEERPSRRVFVPVTRKVDREEAIELSLELPGVRREDVELTLEGRRLTVRARAAGWTAPEGMRALHAELEEVDYEARFALPRGIAAERIEAQLDCGILILRLPKALPERKTILVRGT